MTRNVDTFITTSMPVIEHYAADNKVIEIDSTPSVEAVHAEVRKALDSRFAARAAQQTVLA